MNINISWNSRHNSGNSNSIEQWKNKFLTAVATRSSMSGISGISGSSREHSRVT